MRPWERVGQPKSTGWPTMWPKTTAPRAIGTPQRKGVRGQVGTVKECMGEKQCAKETGPYPLIFKEGNLAEYLKQEQIHSHALYIQSILWNSSATLHTYLLYPFLPCISLVWCLLEMPNHGLVTFFVESRWAMLQVLHRHNSRWCTHPKEGNWSIHSDHTKDGLSLWNRQTLRIMLWSGWILSDGLETLLTWTLKGHMLCLCPKTVLQ